MRTVKLTLQYDGTAFVGWQRQAVGTSIQGVLEDALSRIDGRPVTAHGAGRTDAGVHALAQVASARVETPLDDGTLLRALNANLPPAVRVTSVQTVPDTFHARFSAISKTYEYRIWNGDACPPFIRLYAWHVPQRLDDEAMNRATAGMVGEHDFAVFQGSGSTVASTVRTVIAADWARSGDALAFTISGTGFLRHMVRSIAGTLVEVGRGWRGEDEIARLLRLGDRHAVGRTAPPCGLFLVSVGYGAL